MSQPESSMQEKLAQAMAHHRAGRLGPAAELYQGLIAREPRHADALRLLGVVSIQVGQPGLAVELLERAIAVNEGIAEYHNDLGLALHALGRFEPALGALQRALQLKADLAEAHYNLANTLRALGQIDNAIASYQLALQIRPQYPEALNSMGNALKDRQQFDQAVAAYQAALRLRPDYVDALNNLGNALQTIGANRRQFRALEWRDDELQQAVEAYQAALRLKGDDPQTLNNLGSALAAMGRLDAAMAHYQMALRLRPDYPEALFNAGNALLEQERLPEAAGAYRAALAARPEYPEALVNLGNALKELRQTEAAIGSYRAAVMLAPQMAEAHNNLGTALKEAGRSDEAVAAFRAAVACRENYAEAWSNLGGALKEQGLMGEAIAAYRRAVELAPGRMALHNNLIYALHFDPAYEPGAVGRELTAWNARHAAPLVKLVQEWENDRAAERPLRVGLVSPDFRSHPIGRFILPLLETHDKADCQLFCYSDGKPAEGARDAVTQAIKAHADRWHDTRKLTDRELAGLIRLDSVDVLVDLTMHMEGSRLLVFAQKPAPVQVTYLAYPTSTGLEMMDYRLTDGAFDPEGAAPSPYTEKPLRLASYWCYPAPAGAPPVSLLPAKSAGQVTFGCLNNFSKVSPQALACWVEILRRVPGSRLFLHAAPGSHRERVRGVLAEAGVEPERCEFFGFLPFDEYLALHSRIDIALDPFPYAGGTTTCDALYMGVPVVTLAGPWALSRGGVSIMTAAGMPEMVAGTAQEYVALAASLAEDLPRLETLRAGLREKMTASRLMDGKAFARDFQCAMRRAWRERYSRQEL